ncbi:unnamed protein product [Moneuplotes crassus]|uniref:TsaA-like domain-containing protein n=1 Tax=Euplotes crassus TaxID=5936 RepID=A0AAD1UTL0_EUPCR|nr:unnamed protein product [Moneuplotes crassus]
MNICETLTQVCSTLYTLEVSPNLPSTYSTPKFTFIRLAPTQIYTCKKPFKSTKVQEASASLGSDPKILSDKFLTKKFALLLRIYAARASEAIEGLEVIEDAYFDNSSLCIEVSSHVKDLGLEDHKTREPGGSGVNVRTIGVLRSVFREKFGTPRQSLFTQMAKSSLRVQVSSEFREMYYWVVFVFHKDFTGTNRIYADSERGETVKKGKIKPPKLFGDTMGIFATRSPHRYNPIGISIGKLEKTVVEDDSTTLYFEGLDLVHETPILCVIPYTCDHSVKSLEIPQWLSETQNEKLLDVKFTSNSMEDIDGLLESGILEFYHSSSDLCSLIESVLCLNPHSTHVLKSHNKSQLYGIELDNLNIIYSMDSEKEGIEVQRVLDINNCEEYYGHIKKTKSKSSVVFIKNIITTIFLD